MEYSEKEKEQIGEDIAELFLMRKNKAGLYNTSWGTKTARGIYEVFIRLSTDLENNRRRKRFG